MEILIYENRKIDPMAYDISTPEKEAAAYLAVFKMLDEEWDVYCDIDPAKTENDDICECCAAGLHHRCLGDEEGCGCKQGVCGENKDIEHRFRVYFDYFDLYTKAKAGDWKAAKRLMTSRSKEGFEYESIQTIEVCDPLDLRSLEEE